MAEEIPAGFDKNTPEQLEQLHEAIHATLRHLDPSIHAAALVLVLPNGGVTAALGGDASDLEALANLMSVGPDVLRETLKRFIAGKGTTRVVPR